MTLTAETLLWGLCQRAHDQAKRSGFYDDGPRDPAVAIALLHSELSELLEALRDRNPPSAKCPGLSQCEEEAADVLIRLADLCAAMGWDLGRAVEAKMTHNASRPRKHGREF